MTGDSVVTVAMRNRGRDVTAYIAGSRCGALRRNVDGLGRLLRDVMRMLTENDEYASEYDDDPFMVHAAGDSLSVEKEFVGSTHNGTGLPVQLASASVVG